MFRENTEDYKSLFLKDLPLLDVRAPIEFEKGAFPQSVNVAILDDDQRKAVGTCYKQKGQDKAIELGHELVSGDVKAQRVEAWKAQALSNPEGFLYCFRGGLRSRITQQWLKEAGVEYPLVRGGYKAMRQFLIEEMELNIQRIPFVMIGGRTASGKTHLLKTLRRHIDLEGIAGHRGSSFGALVEPQPTQINFENVLSIAMLKHWENHRQTVFIEDEGRRIGKRILPLSLSKRMAEELPLAMVEIDMEERVASCVQDYITDLFPLFAQAYGEQAHDRFREKYLDNLDRIERRLGGDRHKVIHAQFEEALKLWQGGDSSGFCEPFESLLRDYYDPMYDYQSTKRKGGVLFKGDRSAVVEWAEAYVNPD